jgi:hypothetical protein
MQAKVVNNFCAGSEFYNAPRANPIRRNVDGLCEIVGGTQQPQEPHYFVAAATK